MQIETNVIDYLLDLVDRSDYDQNGRIDYKEWEDMGMWRSMSEVGCRNRR